MTADRTLPTGAVDAHAHTLQPRARSQVTNAPYEPFDASLSLYRAMLTEVGLERGVLVNPSVYGGDHTVLREALRSAPDQLRGIAVVPPEVDDETLAELHRAGIRGCRVQDRFAGGVDVLHLGRLAERVASLGWHLELWTDLRDHLDWLPGVVARCPVPVVFDHFAFLPPEVESSDPAMRELLAMITDRVAWVTLSGAYRLTPGTTEHTAARALTPRVETLCAAAPDQLLWGTDWPHVAPPGPSPTTTEYHEVIEQWLPDPDLRQRILVDNPENLYQFPRATRGPVPEP